MPKITCISYSPVCKDKNYQTGWDDTWISYKIGGKKIKEGPTFIAESNLDDDIEMQKEMIHDYTSQEYLEELKRDHETSPSMFTEHVLKSWGDQELIAGFQADLEKLLATKKQLADCQFVVVPDSDGKNLPNIYIRGEYINRSLIMQAIRFYLNQKGITTRLKFKWEKPYKRLRAFVQSL